MTNFQFVSDLLNIINELLEAGVNGCNNHEARTQLDNLFDNYEEMEGVPSSYENDRGDLELYAYIIDNLHETGYQLWKEKKEQKATLKATLDKIDAAEKKPFSTSDFFEGLFDMMDMPFGGCDHDDF